MCSLPSSSRSGLGSLLARQATRNLPPVSALASTSRCLTSESATPDAPTKTGMPTIFPSTDTVTAQINDLLSPLSLSPLPEALAERLVTHRSAAGRLGNHNGRLAFYGRRVLHFHLALALHSRGAISQALLEQHLSPIELGRSGGVGAALRLEQIMRWRPALPSHYAMSDPNKEDLLGKGSGLWRLRGETVQSLQGAVYSHHGAKASEEFFNAYILKNLSLPGLDASSSWKATTNPKATASL